MAFNVSCSFADLTGVSVSALGIDSALILRSDTAGLIDVTLLAEKTGPNPNTFIGWYWYPDRCVCWWWWKGMGIVILIVILILIVIMILFSLSHVV